MAQLFPSVKKTPSFGSMLGGSIAGGLQRGYESAQNFADQLDLQERKSQSFNEELKRVEKINALQGALSTIERMREIGSKGNLGRGSQFLGYFGGETARDRGEYEQLGKSFNTIVDNYSQFVTVKNLRL